jgi:hypothetical protein
VAMSVMERRKSHYTPSTALAYMFVRSFRRVIGIIITVRKDLTNMYVNAACSQHVLYIVSNREWKFNQRPAMQKAVAHHMLQV